LARSASVARLGRRPRHRLFKALHFMYLRADRAEEGGRSHPLFEPLLLLARGGVRGGWKAGLRLESGCTFCLAETRVHCIVWSTEYFVRRTRDGARNESRMRNGRRISVVDELGGCAS
jgi:hypothetical protein